MVDVGNECRAPASPEELAHLRRMSAASCLEGATLLILVCIAVPLKYVAGYPGMVKAVGPVHGIAFLLYFWLLVQTISFGQWRRREILRMVLAALVPFGAFISARALARRAAKRAPRPCAEAAS